MSLKKSLALALVAATCFVHFKNPADGSHLYLLNEDKPEGATDGSDGYARDSRGEKYPIGVVIHGPGSIVHRKAEDFNANANIKAGRKHITGATLRADATRLLARCTEMFVNFEYNGQDVTEKTTMEERERIASAFYEDTEYVAFREQVLEEQVDLGNFSKRESTG